MKIVFHVMLFLNIFLPSAHSEYQYTYGCNILSSSFKLIKKLPGKICAFDSDGSFYRTLDGKGVEKISKLGKSIWKIPQTAHHQIKISRDRSKVYFLTDEIVKVNGKSIRTDALALVDSISGKNLKIWSQFNHRSEMKKFDPGYPDYFASTSNWSKNILKVPYETMHFNSIDEIPELKGISTVKGMTAGNFIVNFTNVASFAILDSKLKSTLWTRHFRGYIHDVQVTNEGKILYYLNNYIEPNFKKQSQIIIYDPTNDSETVLYPKNAQDPFYSRDMGGVQLLPNDEALVNENSPERGGSFRVVSKEGKIIISNPNIEIDSETGLPAMVQEIKRLDLNDFLKKNLL